MTTVEFKQLRSTLVALAVMSSVAVAFAQEPATRVDAGGLGQSTNSFSRTCALHDVELVTLIEELGESRQVAGHKLYEATLAMMRARTACAERGESEALSIYDAIKFDLAPTRLAR